MKRGEKKNQRSAAREKAREKARKLLDKMTVEEKASLLKYDSPAIPRLNIPEYNWWNEALHGVARAGTATVFPVPIALAAAFDLKLIKEIGSCISTEGRAKYNEFQKEEDYDIYKGLTYWSPNINIFRDPRWGRGHETFGEDPFLTGRMGAGFIQGLQGDNEQYLKTAACVKHLAVHSGPEELRHEFDARVSEKDLWETYLPAFEYCVKEGEVEGAMGGYSSLNGTPLCGNRRLIQEILREKWGFDGYYVSDCWALRDFHEHHMVTNSPEESAAMAIKAGCDINCGSCYNQLMKAYYRGMVTEKEIDTAALRALTTRLLLGMNENTPWDNLSCMDVDTAEAEQLNLRAAGESVVLLKNNGILPLDMHHISVIGVIGPNADAEVVLHGNYHGTASHYVTVMEGLRNALGDGKPFDAQENGQKKNVRILYAQGSVIVNSRTERLARENDRVSEAAAVAKASDVVILCVGLDERYEGEAHHISTGECMGGDKENLQFPDSQHCLIESVLACGKPVVICCMTGSCLDLSPYEERAAAILQAWYPGAQGGTAVANILLGEISPSGKLPVTFYGKDYDIPEYTDYSMKNRTYRYVEKGVLYPFGYGLTYGKGRVARADYDKKRNSVRFSVKNDSSRAIEEVVQIYKKNPNSCFEVRNVSLCGFQRMKLLPWETAEGEIFFDQDTFTVVNEAGERIQDGNEYLLFVGTHGPDARSVQLTGSESIVLKVVPAENKEEETS